MKANEITFEDITTKDSDKFILHFYAHQNNERIKCGITHNALKDDYKDDNCTPEEAFNQNRKNILEAAKHRIENGERDFVIISKGLEKQ